VPSTAFQLGYRMGDQLDLVLCSVTLGSTVVDLLFHRKQRSLRVKRLPAVCTLRQEIQRASRDPIRSERAQVVGGVIDWYGVNGRATAI
jgi:hypothetical protein